MFADVNKSNALDTENKANDEDTQDTDSDQEEENAEDVKMSGGQSYHVDVKG